MATGVSPAPPIANRRPGRLRMLYDRRGLPVDSESGRTYLTSSPAPGATRWRMPAGPRARTSDAAGGAQSSSGAVGRPDHDEPGPGPVPGSRVDGGPARPVRRRGRRHRNSVGPPCSERLSTMPSTATRYAGWADKISQVLGSANPVAAPSLTSPSPRQPRSAWSRPSRAPARPVSRLAPVLSLGNAASSPPGDPPAACVTLGEVLATSDASEVAWS